MLKNSNRSQDMNAEQCLAEFLDRFLYEKIEETSQGRIKITRQKNSAIQLNGTDILWEVRTEGKTREIAIDEKAALYYSNTMIPTFAFEIDSIQRIGHPPVTGWFLREDLDTQYYMLIWPNVKCEQNQDKIWVQKKIKELQVEDFTIIEAMMISKQKILLYLESRGWERKRLLDYARTLRENREYGRKRPGNRKDFYFTFSNKIAEQPINLIIRKPVLIELAQRRYFVSKDGFSQIQ